MNTIIDLIKQRVSCPKLAGNAPSEQELHEILACALRAPDHGRLKPWHFHIVQGDARNKLGYVFEINLCFIVSYYQVLRVLVVVVQLL